MFILKIRLFVVKIKASFFSIRFLFSKAIQATVKLCYRIRAFNSNKCPPASPYGPWVHQLE